MNPNNQNKQLVKQAIGHTIGTIYGPSTVIGFVPGTNETKVALKEGGTEEYHVELSEWHLLTNV